MIKYLLDTNIISYFADDGSPYHSVVVERISNLKDQESVCLSMLTIYEFQYGISVVDASLAKKFADTKKLMMQAFDILNLTTEGAEIFGALKAAYQKKYKTSDKYLSRHNIDFMLASSAVAEGAVLVSHDDIFRKIAGFHSGFRYENWAE